MNTPPTNHDDWRCEYAHLARFGASVALAVVSIALSLVALALSVVAVFR